jgi:hypothetical protein
MSMAFGVSRARPDMKRPASARALDLRGEPLAVGHNRRFSDPERPLGVTRSHLIIQAIEPHVATRVAETPREDFAISEMTAAEIEFGLRYLPASKRRKALEAQWSAIARQLIRLPWSDEVRSPPLPMIRPESIRFRAVFASSAQRAMPSRISLRS